VRKNNEPLNPVSLDIPVAQVLEGNKKAAFQASLAQLRGQLDLLGPRLASAPESVVQGS